jgi:hypothetical protein
MTRTKSFDAIIFDFERVWVDQDGSEMASCPKRDGFGFDILRQSSQARNVLAGDCPDKVLAARGESTRLDTYTKQPCMRTTRQTHDCRFRAFYPGSGAVRLE